MLTQGRTILVATLALAALGAGPAMAKMGGAGPGATEAIEVLQTDVDALETRVDTIENDTPGGVGACGTGQIAKFDGTWGCDDDDDTTVIDWDDLFNLPPGFDDDTDDDTLGGVTGCASGQVAKSNGDDTWDCQNDEDTANTDTLGDVTGCASGQVAKSNGDDTWDCQDDDTGGGGGSPFTLTDTDAFPISVGTVIGIARRSDVLSVSTLLTSTDIAALSARKIVLEVRRGFFTSGAVFWTGTNCDDGGGTPHVTADAGFLTTIHAASVVKARSSSTRLLYVADSTAVINITFDSLQTGTICDVFTSGQNNVVTADAGIDVSTLFTTPIVLGGGP